MTASTHLAVGAAAGLIAQEFLSPSVSVPEKLFWSFTDGFVSHLVLDAIPHQEYTITGTGLLLILLAETAIVFALVLSSQNSLLLNSVIFFGMVGGALPDVIELVCDHIFDWSWLMNLGGIIHFFHYKRPPSFVWSFYLQVVLAIVAVVLVRLKSTS